MNLDIKKFYQATNPSRTLDIQNPDDEKYYIDFSSVRGGQIIEELKNRIAWADDNEFTCNLFTGHIGCGKSTELLRLKKELEDEGFHVVYFESDEDLDIGDVDISDILLAIASCVSQSLEAEQSQEKSEFFQDLLQKAKSLFLNEIQLSAEGQIPGVGDLGIEIADDVTVNFSTAIGKISATTKKNRDLHDRLRAYLEPKTDGLLTVLNQGLFEPTAEKLQELAKQGLVVIIDNLDRLLKIERASGRFQPQYIFADRGADLTRLHCHVIYTMPLKLRYSNDYNLIKERFKGLPIQAICEVQIDRLRLDSSDVRLYSKIREQVEQKSPAAMMILGLEAVNNIDDLLRATNQVREEFRKNCDFPLVIWIDDQILGKLKQIAPDFKNWGTTV